LLLPLPWQDATFEAVYSSHVLEHLPRGKAPLLLKQIRRILRPKGILRLVVPDLAGIARAYLESFQAAKQELPGSWLRHEWMTLELLDQLVREKSGGFMRRWWELNPVPGQEFIQARVGQEATAHWENRSPHAGTIPSTDPIYLDELVDEKSRLAFLKTGENHRWMYDEISLGQLLIKAGFKDVKSCQADESAIGDFPTYHLDTDKNGRVRKPDSLFMEGRAP
jgi:SAM-dependent methyltransferase